MPSPKTETGPATDPVTLDVLDAIPSEVIPAAIARLAARAMVSLVPNSSPAPVPGDELLTVEEAANLLKVRPQYVYNHARALGVVRLGRKVRFSRQKLLRRLAA